MAKSIGLYPDTASGIEGAADFLLDWNWKTNGAALGGATGNSPVGVWATVWRKLEDHPEAQRKLVRRQIAFLDEYLGGFPSYHHWAWRNLRIGRGGFPAENISVPRGCFFEGDRIVTSIRLDAILAETTGQWEALTEAGADDEPPEIRIKGSAVHPVLCEIRDSVTAYDRFVRALPNRLQILGIGVEGHIGFVERGAAARDTGVMLAKLASSTLLANENDFRLRNHAGEDISLEPAHYAITQGIGTVLSAGHILMLAWGVKKRSAVERMLLHDPGAQNPAGWIQEHENVTIVLDVDAFGSLKEQDLMARGFRVERHESPQKDEVLGY